MIKKLRSYFLSSNSLGAWKVFFRTFLILLATVTIALGFSQKGYGLELLLRPTLVETTYNVEFIDETLTASSFSLGFGLTHDVTRKVSLFAYFAPTISDDASQLARYIYAGGFNYYFKGQTKKIKRVYKHASLETFGHYGVYIPVNFNFNIFQVSLEGRSGRLKGSLFSLSWGLGYRYDVDSNYSVGAEYLRSESSFAGGNGTTTAEDSKILVFAQISFGQIFKVFEYF